MPFVSWHRAAALDDILEGVTTANLMTTAPSGTGAPTSGTVASGTGYAAVTGIEWDEATVDTPSVATNLDPIEWPIAGGSWGTIVAVRFDGFGWFAVDPSIAVGLGDLVYIEAGDVEVVF